MIQAIVFVVMLLISGISHASANSITDARELAIKLNNIRSFKANIQQNDLRGRIFFRKPNLLRWEIVEPAYSLIIATAGKIWHYDRDLAQVLVYCIKNQSSNLVFFDLLIADAKDLERKFNIKKYAYNKFKLMPIKNNANFATIDLEFHAAKLVKFSIVDTLGRSTSFKFTNVKINIELHERLFKFVVPENVDIVDRC